MDSAFGQRVHAGWLRSFERSDTTRWSPGRGRHKCFGRAIMFDDEVG